MVDEKDLIEIVDRCIDTNKYLVHVQDPCVGAICTFIGTTRDHFQGKRVSKLEYEAYEPMAREIMRCICREARKKWNIVHCAVAHRTGTVDVGETSVWIAVSSIHRKDALESVSYIIDEIKSRAPIWKKEHYEDGSVWKENIESRVPCP